MKLTNLLREQIVRKWPFRKVDNGGEKCFCGLWEIDPECPVHGPKYRAEFPAPEPVAPPAGEKCSHQRVEVYQGSWRCKDCGFIGPSPSPAIGDVTCRVCGGDGDEPTPPNVSRPCHNCGGTGIEKPAVRKLLNLFWSECITSDVDIEAQRLIASLLGKFSDYHNLDWGKP